jgi:hypothetical protein
VAAAQLKSQTDPCGTCCGQCGIGKRFSPSTTLCMWHRWYKKYLNLTSYFYVMAGLSLTLEPLKFTNSRVQCFYCTETAWVEISWACRSSEEKKCLENRTGLFLSRQERINALF